MKFSERLRQLILGTPHAETGLPSEGSAYPQPIDFIEAMKVRMRDDIMNITPAKALVPGHYTVLIHQEAHERLQPVLNQICEAAAEELSNEVERISRIPYGDPIDQAVDFARREFKRKVKKQPVAPVQREIYPPDYAWSIEVLPVLYDHHGNDAPLNYLAVSTDLVHGKAPGVLDTGAAGDRPRMTVKDPFTGLYESHFVHASGMPSADGRSRVTVSAPFKQGGQAVKPPLEGTAGPRPPGTLATLTYQYPGRPETHTFAMTQKEIIIGRKTDGNDYVHLRLDVQYEVSEEHARLRYNEAQGHFELMDVSSNGTRIDEEKVPRSDPKNYIEHWHPVPDGAEINLAGYLFLTFHRHIG